MLYTRQKALREADVDPSLTPSRFGPRDRETQVQHVRLSLVRQMGPNHRAGPGYRCTWVQTRGEETAADFVQRKLITVKRMFYLLKQ